MRKSRYHYGPVRHKKKDSHRYRTVGLGILTLTVILALGGQAFHLQVLQGEAYAAKLQSIRLGREAEPSIRGRILDAKGEVLASTTVRRLVSMVETFKGVSGANRQQLIEEVARMCGVSVLVAQEALSLWRDLPLRPDVVVTNPHIAVTLDFRRNYHFEGSLSHLVGYVNRDMLGMTGIESQYHHQLIGTPGEKIKEMDASTRVLQYRLIRPPVHGSDIRLTIDAHLQQQIDALLIAIAKPSVVILSDPQSGDILAMNAYPFFSSDEMTNRLSPQRWQQLQEDSSFPFLNRAIQSIYNPGSLLKPFIALAALQWPQDRVQQLITERVRCRGHFDLELHSGGFQRYRDWRESGHGMTTLYSAIMESCNVFFYQLGIQLGIEMMKEVADMVRLDGKTGIDLPSETGGVFPSNPWKIQRTGERWYTGDTVLTSIGEGFVRLTPIQILKIFELIGNEGWIFPPGLDQQRRNLSSTLIEMPEGFWTYLKYAMNAVVVQQAGTAYGVFRETPYASGLAGKTGTAESGSAGIYHSWFAGFYPLSNPEVAIVVLIESGGFGSTAAAPLARQVLDLWWSGRAVRDP